jgi:hypothetical protein
MKRSGDLVIGRSGDLKSALTAEPRRRGEKPCQDFTTETRRHGEGSGDRAIARDRVIGKDACICLPERAGAHAGAPNTRVFRVVGWSHATARRRIPATTVPEHAVSGSSHKTLRDFVQRFRKAIRTLRAALREIFDESAYDRFLLRNNAAPSISSYRAFISERDSAMQKKPRCC